MTAANPGRVSTNVPELLRNISGKSWSLKWRSYWNSPTTHQESTLSCDSIQLEPYLQTLGHLNNDPEILKSEQAPALVEETLLWESTANTGDKCRWRFWAATTSPKLSHYPCWVEQWLFLNEGTLKHLHWKLTLGHMALLLPLQTFRYPDWQEEAKIKIFFWRLSLS